MRSYLGTALLISFALMLLTCTPATKQPEPEAEATNAADDMAALDGLRGDFMAAYNAGDASTLATLFTEDGVVMPPNSSAANGKEAVESFYQVHFEQFTATLAVSSEEHEVAGDWAFERGSYTVTLTPKANGTPTDDEGKYLLISRRQPDASWRNRSSYLEQQQPGPRADPRSRLVSPSPG